MGSEITKTESVMYGSIKWEKKDVTLIEFYNLVFENDGDYCYIFSGDKVNEISINKFDYINNCVVVYTTNCEYDFVKNAMMEKKLILGYLNISLRRDKIYKLRKKHEN